MRTNASIRPDTPVHKAHPRDEMCAYDLLDPRLREFVSKAPEQFSCVWLLSMQLEHGVDAMLASGAQMIKQRYPDWTPI
jgi:hypothetical protein